MKFWNRENSSQVEKNPRTLVLSRVQVRLERNVRNRVDSHIPSLQGAGLHRHVHLSKLENVHLRSVHFSV